MRNKPFRHNNWEVTQQLDRFRVSHVRTGQVFHVDLIIADRRRHIGRCSCGSPAADLPFFFCDHQTSAYELINSQWLANLPKRVPFRHPERLTPEFQRNQERLMSALRRHSRAGHLPCPHCKCKITTADLDPERDPGLPLRQGAFAFSEGGAS